MKDNFGENMKRVFKKTLAFVSAVSICIGSTNAIAFAEGNGVESF